MKLAVTTRIVVYFSLLAGALLLAAGLLSYRSGSHSLEQAAVSEMVAIAVEKEAALDAWLTKRAAEVTRVAGQGDLVEAAARLDAAAPGSRESDAAHAALDDVLASQHAGPYAACTELFVMQARDGRVVASTKPAEVGRSEGTRAYFEHGRTRTFLQPPYLAQPGRPFGPLVSAPLRTPDRTLVGVLAVRLDLADMDAVVRRRSGLRASEDAYLVGADRHFVTQPRFIAAPAVFERRDDTAAAHGVAARRSGVAVGADYRGVPAIAVYRWLGTQQVGLVVKVDRDEALAPARAFGASLAWIGASGMLAALALAVVLARSIARPLTVLHDKVQRFGEGSDETALAGRRGDDIDRLGLAFDRMAARVAERTGELARTNEALRAENAERRRTEQQLRDSKTRFSRIVENVSDVVAVVGFDGIVAYASPSLLTVGGYDPQKLVGRSYLALLAADELPRLQGYLAEMAAKPGQPLQRELRFRHRDGTPLYGDCLARNLVGVPGIDGIVVVVRDVTWRKRAEDALRRQKAELQLLFDLVPAVVMFLDTNERVMRTNRHGAAALGRPVEQIEGRLLADLDAECAALLGADDRAVVRSGASKLGVEVLRHRADGSDEWRQIDRVPVCDADGRVSGLVVMAQDITERKRSERELRQLNARFKALSESNAVAAAVIENSAEGVMIIDAALRIERVNTAFERITGYAAADVIGRSPKVLWSGRHDEAFFRRLHERVDTSGQWRGEIWNRRRNGELYPQQTSINILRDADGRIRHYASLFSDDTARNQLEARLRELSERDALTGLANRRTFDGALAREWARAQREVRPLSLLIVDIDHFKRYNDRYGHPAGDACLRQVAAAIGAVARRAVDVAARYGGEEFALVLPSTDAAAAAAVAEEVRAGVAALALPHETSDVAPFVTVSVGAATTIPGRSSGAQHLLAAADRALYEAKHAGRNEVATASPVAAGQG